MDEPRPDMMKFPASPAPHRQTERLRLGRNSLVGAVYFVTFVTTDRTPWLATPTATQALLKALRTWHEEHDGSVLAASVMPDHAHVLFSLGSKLEVGRCVSRWKAVAQRLSGYPGKWQRDFWEHRLRDVEGWEDYALYIFLNPYRAGLLRHGSWPGWWAPEAGWFRFLGCLEPDGGPPTEWLAWSDDRFANITTSE